MGSLNRVILVGNLGADPETRYLPDGAAVTNIRIATSRRWKDRNDEMKEETEWHRIVFFGKLAEIAGEYLVKGGSVCVEGRLRTRKWQDKDGQDRYSTEIVADSLQMLGSRSGDNPREPREPRGESSRSSQPKGSAGKQPAGKFDDMEDDIPF